jgi:hypothetical protein
MEIIRKDYELSIWETAPEKKIVIIGSQEKNDPAQAKDLVLIKKVNGEY